MQTYRSSVPLWKITPSVIIVFYFWTKNGSSNLALSSHRHTLGKLMNWTTLSPVLLHVKTYMAMTFCRHFHGSQMKNLADLSPGFFFLLLLLFFSFFFLSISKHVFSRIVQHPLDRLLLNFPQMLNYKDFWFLNFSFSATIRFTLLASVKYLNN